MPGREDEEEERRRQERKRKSMPPIDRLYDNERDPDDFRTQKRTGRLIPLYLRLHPRVKAILVAIMARDRAPSVAALFEDMLDAYQKVYGAIDSSQIPSDDELVNRLLRKRDNSDRDDSDE